MCVNMFRHSPSAKPRWLCASVPRNSDMRTRTAITLLLMLVAQIAEAGVVRFRIERREVVLDGRAFGAAGPYEKLLGKVDFALDPSLPANGVIVDLKLAPRNALGQVESSADFFLLK